MVSINNLGVEFSARPLFSDISLIINPSDKIALVGKNGAGKSTLLKIIAGLQAPSAGSVTKGTGVSIGYLPQQMVVADDTTLLEETRKAFQGLEELKKELELANQKLADRDDYETEEYSKFLDYMESLRERISIYGAENMVAEMERTLLGLGFSREDFNRPTSEFSGGWRMRIELAKILLQRPDLILLDEPTNHLDIESIRWLERFLRDKAKSVVLVSHDRAFLDNVTKRTLEISCGKAYDYKVNYSRFVELRKERVAQQMRAYENQQKQIADIKDFIEKFRYKPTKAVQVQSRIKQLEKIIPIEVDEVDNSRLRLKFPPALRSGDFPLIVDNVTKQYGTHTVFSEASLTLKRGEKVAFVGKNGEGKSTMVKCIMRQTEYSGSLRIGHNVNIGYFAQNQAQLLDESATVFDTVDRVATGDMRLKVRDLLGAFMFGGENADKKVSVLSGGEKTRLAMIKLLLEPVNFLILDEPTNHLDMKTKDILKEAIREFDGTVIVVSHDREFLDGLVDKVYEFSGGKVSEHIGGIYEYLRKKDAETIDNAVNSKTLVNAPAKDTDDSPIHTSHSTGGAKDYAEQKEREKKIRRLEKNVRETELQISSLENRQQELETKIASGDSSSETLQEYSSIAESLEQAMGLWEKACEELDNVKSSR